MRQVRRLAVSFLLGFDFQVFVYATGEVADLAVDESELVIGYALHEIAVVGDQKQRARPAIQQAFHSGQHVSVQVVAGLVQDEHVGLVQQNEHESQSALLAAGQIAHGLVLVVLREAQALQQLARGHFLAVEHSAARVARDHLTHTVVAQLGELIQMLRQHSEAHGLANFHAAAIKRLQSLNNAQQRGLADAVLAHNAVAIAGADDPVHIRPE